MTGIPETLVRLASRALPPLLRDRYREEWLADLAGAAEAGVARSSVVVGALTTAATIDRLDPSASGMTLSRVFVLRLRVAAGFGLAATVVAVGSGVITPEPPGGIAAALTALALTLAAVGAVAGTGAVRAAVRARRVGTALVVVLAALILVAVVSSRVGFILVVLAAGPGLILLLVLAMALTGGRVAAAPTRIAAAVLGPIAALAVAAVGLAHVFVWNPLAKLPALTLAEIYAALEAAGEGVNGGSVVWIVAVTTLVVFAAGAYVVFALAPVGRWQRMRTTRRLLALGLLLVVGTVALVFLPAFGMGMGIADAFGTTGTAASASGTVLTLIGVLSVAATIVVTFVRVEPDPHAVTT